MTRELIVPTKRRAMTRQRAAKIFLREQGCCYLCGRKLRIGVDKYQIEHPEALILGGSDDDADLRVVCLNCHPKKTAADAAARSERDRHVTAGWSGKDHTKYRWGKRPLGTGNHQHTATSKPTKRVGFIAAETQE